MGIGKSQCVDVDPLSREIVCLGEPRQARKGATVAQSNDACGGAEGRKRADSLFLVCVHYFRACSHLKST
jgi:hypothetical protein